MLATPAPPAICHQVKCSYAVIRTMLPSGKYRYHRIVVRQTATGGGVSFG